MLPRDSPGAAVTHANWATSTVRANTLNQGRCFAPLTREPTRRVAMHLTCLTVGLATLVLQLDFETRVSAPVMAEFGDGLMAASPAAPVQDEVQGRPHHPCDVQQQAPEFLDGEADESRPWRRRNRSIRRGRRVRPSTFGSSAASSLLASTRAAARNACATMHN